MEKKNIWSTDDIIQNRNNWSLAGDAELLKHLQALSEKIISKSQMTLNLLNSFENDVNKTCISVANINNRFTALSDTQFIENKVQDEILEPNECELVTPEAEDPRNKNITVKLKEALDNGINVLHSHYHIIPITDSDSDDEEPQEVLLKARNPYMSRRLPYIIGTEDFTKYDHLGLVTSSEDEEEEEVEEKFEPSEAEDANVMAKIPPQSIADNIKVIHISSSESDISIENDESSKMPNNSSDINSEIKTTQTQHSFADHLNATLQNVTTNSVPPLIDDKFTPPPFPSRDMSDYHSDEEKSDSSGDIFASCKRLLKQPKTSHTSVISGSNMSDNICDDKESSNKIFQNTKLSSSNSRRSSSGSATSQSSKSDPLFEKQPVNPVRKFSNFSQNKIFSAVNNELNAKLKINARIKNDQSSSDENDSHALSISQQKNISEEDTEFRPTKKNNRSAQKGIENETPNAQTSAVKTKKNTKNTSNSIANKNKRNDKSGVSLPTSPSNIFQDPLSEDDKTKSTAKSPSTNVKRSPLKSNVADLFDEDDSLDDLFKPNTKVGKPTSVTSKDWKTDSLFEDDDSSLLNNSQRQKVDEKIVPIPVTSSKSLFSKKLDLFDDDSDPEDAIFAIINSQKKKSRTLSVMSTAVASDITKEELLSTKDDDLFSSLKSKANNKSKILPTKAEDVISSGKDNLFGEVLEDEDLFISMKSSSQLKPVFNSSDQTVSEKIDTLSSDGTPETLSKVAKCFVKPVTKNVDLFTSDSEDSDVEDINSFLGGKSTDNPAKPVMKNLCQKKEEKKIKTSGLSFHSKNLNLFDSDNDNLLEAKHKPAQQSINSNILNSEADSTSGSNLQNRNLSEFDIGSFSKAELTRSEQLFEPPVNTSRILQAKSDTANVADNFEVSRSVLKGDKSIVNEKSTQIENYSVTDEKSDVLKNKNEHLKVLEKQPTGETNKKGISAFINGTEAQDERDGNLLGKTPGKLSAFRGLYINVNALLPSSIRPSTSRQQTETTDSESQQVTSGLQDIQKSSSVLTNVFKERVKVAARRRPPSRRGRINKLRQSNTFAAVIDSSDEEPDSAYKTASESNSPNNKTIKTSVTMSSKDDKLVSNDENTANVASSVASLLDDSESFKNSDLFVRNNDSVMPSKTNTEDQILEEPMSSSTLPYHTKDYVKVSNLKPESMLKQSDKKTEKASESAEATAWNKRNEIPLPSSDIGDDIFSASSSREPPVMEEDDFKNLFGNSDEDEELFSDVVFKDRSHVYSEVESSDIASFPVDVEGPMTRISIASSRLPPELPSHQPVVTNTSKLSKTSSRTGVKKTVTPPKVFPDLLSQQFVSASIVEAAKSAKTVSTDLFSEVGNDSEDLFTKPVVGEKSLPAPIGTKFSKTVSETSVESVSASNAGKTDKQENPLTETMLIKSTPVEVESNLFLDLEKQETDDRIFKSSATQAVKSSAKTESEKKHFDKKGRTSHVDKPSSDLFADDDDYFFSSKKPLIKSKIGSKSFLFDDDDDDDDNLFGGKQLSHSRKSVEPTRRSKSSTITEKVRVVKLRSEIVRRDPLTDEIIKK